MLIPKQDLIDGLPIRWAFHCWMTAPDSSGRWASFAQWRKYLLSWDTRGYELLPEYLEKDPIFEQDVKRFLFANDADTLADFIRFYQKGLRDYALLLKKEGIKS